MEHSNKIQKELVEEINRLEKIVEQQKQEERTNHQDRKALALEKAIETIDIGVTLTDPNGKILYTNPAEAKMHGYRVEELIGKHAKILAPKKLWDNRQKEDGHKIEDMKNWKRESVNVRKNGTTFPVQLVSNSIKDSSGKSIGIVTISEDISQRKRSEAILRESMQRFRAIVENAEAIVYAIDPDCILTYVSPKWEQYLGYAIPEVEGKSLKAFLHPEEADLCDDLFLRGHKDSELDHVNIEHRLRHKNGEWRWFTVSISSVSNADGKLLYYICVGHDVSDRIRAEEELRHALIDTIRETEKQKMVADQASQLKTELLEIAAHDLKNPLTTILGFAQMIRMEAQKNSSIAESAELIEGASQRMLKIISQLIQGSALESGELELEKELFDISVVSEFVITNNKPLATQKKQNLIPSLEEDLMVHGEMDRIIEIIDNLISNAIKYSPIGGKIWVNLTQENGNARFEVVDEGPGLSDEEQTKLFKKFTRLSPEPTGGETSTGLGLSIVKKLVELHDGEVGVESEPGNGSMFYFTIPLEK